MIRATAATRDNDDLTNFREAIYTKNFVLTTECFLRPETNAKSIGIQAQMLKKSVDAVLVTDNQHGQLHMSGLAAARLLIDNGMDPVLQLSCRNRNRIALMSDLMGASALGINNLMLIRGDRVPAGFNPRPKAVFDVNAKELIGTANTMNEDERLTPPPSFFIGGVVTPHGPKPGWVPNKLIEKADAGLHFVFTHLCMDMKLLRDYMHHLVSNELTRRIAVVVSIAVLKSAEDALWLKKHRPNATIPDSLIKRLQTATDAEKEGITICAEQLQELSTIPGIDGANIIASTDLSMVPAAIASAKLTIGTDK